MSTKPGDVDFLFWDISVPVVEFLCLIPIFWMNLKVQKIQFKDDAQDLTMVDATVLTIYMFIAISFINIICMVIFESLQTNDWYTSYGCQMCSGWLILNCTMAAVVWSTTFKLWRAAWQVEFVVKADGRASSVDQKPEKKHIFNDYFRNLPANTLWWVIITIIICLAVVGLTPAAIARLWSMSAVYAGYIVMGPLIIMQFLMSCIMFKAVCVVRRAAKKISYEADMFISNLLILVATLFLLYTGYLATMFLFIWDEAAKTKLAHMDWKLFYQTQLINSIFRMVILCIILFVDIKFA